MIVEDHLRKLEDEITGINHRLMQVRRVAAGGVTASANITDHSIVRGDGGAKGIQGSLLYITDAGNLLLGSAAAGAAATKTLVVETGTPPAGNSVDSFQLYSADFAAGNACPTFRTENGTIIQLNQSLLTTSSPLFAGVTLGNEGLHILDLGGDHDLIIKPGTDLSADSILTITTGDAARTITLAGNPTLNAWFDQNVKQAASPTFVTAKLSGLTDGYIPYHVNDATGLANTPIFSNGTLIGIGATTLSWTRTGGGCTAKLLVEGAGAASEESVAFRREHNTLFPRMGFLRARAGPATVADDDYLALITFMAHDGNDYNFGAGIFARIDGAPTSNEVPTELIFLTTPTNSLQERLIISPAGNFDFKTGNFANVGSVGCGDITSGDITAGHLALGGAVINPDYGIYYTEHLIDTDNSIKSAFQASLFTYKTAAPMTSSARGMFIGVNLDSLNTQNWTSAAGLRGVYSFVGTEALSSGIITGAASIFTYADIADAATVTNLYGIFIFESGVAGNKVVNEYGIYIGDKNKGSALNYAIYTNAGKVRIGDDLVLDFGGVDHTVTEGIADSGGAGFKVLRVPN